MSYTLGAVTFDDACTSVSEKLAEIGGRDARVIVLSGVIRGPSSVEDIEAELDAVAGAAPEDASVASLSLRSGRRLLVRRTAFSREVNAASLVGAFTLTLASDDPLEEAETEAEEEWTIAYSGATRQVNSVGTAAAPVRISFVASGNVVMPSFGDGARTARYEGTVGNGGTLVFDGIARRVWLDGEDATPYVSGVFPRLDPGVTTLRFTDAVHSSHGGVATLTYRDRWY